MRKPNKTDVKADAGTPAMTAAMLTLNPAMTKAWVDIMSEGARFLTERLHQDLDTQKALLACKSPTELLEVQSAFFKTAMAHYTDYAKRFQSKIATVTEDTMKGARSGFSRGYDDVPL
ncbi:phasin family protein [Roseovarius sp.]|uniref:phasin family protein n=1 Tax=Roseovarius sp. TaxID=1486281 RepID=UPI003A981FF4